jgi:hypothetical protein
MTLEPVAYVYFGDGAKRPIFEDTRGQFGFDDDVNQISGIWSIPSEACVQGQLIDWADGEPD